MGRSNRDLLVMFNQSLMSEDALQTEIDYLHELLTHTERMEKLIVAHELIDLNKYKIINKPLPLRAAIKSVMQKPFVFLNCKN
ncbi:MAG: hypothetical protein ACOYKE_06590 [Ferruginibacter sp.]